MFPVCRSPSDHTCLLVSTPNKALSQSFENLLDDNNFGLVHVRCLTVSHRQLLGSNIWICLSHCLMTETRSEGMNVIGCSFSSRVTATRQQIIIVQNNISACMHKHASAHTRARTRGATIDYLVVDYLFDYLCAECSLGR